MLLVQIGLMAAISCNNNKNTPDSAFPRTLHRGVLGHSSFGIAKNTDKSVFFFKNRTHWHNVQN